MAHPGSSAIILYIIGGTGLTGSFSRMLNAQMVFLVYLAMGIYCMRTGLANRKTKEKLMDIILKITLPCMIFNSLNKPLTPEVLIQTALILVVAVVISILSFLLGKVVHNEYPQEEKGVLQYCTLINNSGFLGMLMVSAVYGSDSLFAASIFITPNRIFIWTAGLAMFTTTDFRTKYRNVLLSPYIVTVFLDIVCRTTGFPIPGFLDEAVVNIGAVTTPLPMMVTGTMLIGVPRKKFLEPSIFYLAFVCLIALPLVALFILNLIRAEPMLAGVSLVLTGVPAGSTGALLAVKYGADKDHASRRIVTTTIMSLATIPALMLLL